MASKSMTSKSSKKTVTNCDCNKNKKSALVKFLLFQINIILLIFITLFILFIIRHAFSVDELRFIDDMFSFFKCKLINK